MWDYFFQSDVFGSGQKMHLKKTIFADFCRFLATLQMQFAQSSSYVECILVPFSLSVGRNLSKNWIGFGQTILKWQEKSVLKNQFFVG